MNSAYVSDDLETFLVADPNAILGRLNENAEGSVEEAQRDAWRESILMLQDSLQGLAGRIHFEYSIPRMGKRVDVVVVLNRVVAVLEFKVGGSQFHRAAKDQVWDYALDLKNFHETSHRCSIAPILVVPDGELHIGTVSTSPRKDQLFDPICANRDTLRTVIDSVALLAVNETIVPSDWEKGRYSPTPTIIEAALALYRGHAVEEISRSDAGAKNLHETTESISNIIEEARSHRQKAICFVTGVPGAGKTLIGLNIATKHLETQSETYSVFLSGNGPLVNVLQEALARDLVARRKQEGKRLTKTRARSEVKAFVQNVHHYRDAYLRDETAPADHVALFDEAQRAWNLHKTCDFMSRKKKITGFRQSEPEFLISCIDRHEDWGVIVCLVGGGQEINTGEAGIGEWVDALNRSFPDWHIHVSPRLTDEEYGAGRVLERIQDRPQVSYNPNLHLGVSMRSYRAENVSQLVKQILDLDAARAAATFRQLQDRYPIVLTRDVNAAKQWLRSRARGNERYGMVVSSQAERLKPHAIDVKSPMDPTHWFLNGKEDVRSSYYLEHVATEFSIQGLELDWACVTWDADFRYTPAGWTHRSFKGSTWQKILKAERQIYQKNAYRVLLTRARQGMVIVVPHGDKSDPTRLPEFYNDTYAYLQSCGLHELS